MTSGKRIELAVVGDSLSNFLQSQAGQEAVVHFKVHPDDIAMLTKDRVTGIRIIGKTGSYNYDLHETAQVTFNAQLDLVKKW